MAPLAQKHRSVRDGQREEGGTENHWLCHLTAGKPPGLLGCCGHRDKLGEKLRLILPWAIAAAQVPGWAGAGMKANVQRGCDGSGSRISQPWCVEVWLPPPRGEARLAWDCPSTSALGAFLQLLGPST